MRKQLVWLSVCMLVCIVALTSIVSQAAIPHRISYQGRLVDSGTGQPLPGPHTMQFRIYDVANLGTDLWSEEQPVVADTTGVVSVVLGSVAPINIAFDGRLWLEVQVGGEILQPRRELVSVPYAFHAMDSDSLGGLHSDSYSLVGHTHDDRYYTETELSTSDGSDPNTGLNAVHWNNLNGVPAGFADGVDDGGTGAGDGYSLDADDGYPENVVYVNASGYTGIGTNQAERLLHVYDGSAGTVTSVDAAELVVEDDGNARINMLTPNNKSAGIDFGDPQDANVGWVMYEHTTDKLSLGVNNADRVVVESDGDVNLNAGAGVAFADDNTKVYESTDDLYATADDDLYLQPDDDVYVAKDGTAAWARFDSDNERLGLGTTAPQERLHVAGDIRLDAGGDVVFGDDNTMVYESTDDLYMTADDDLYLSPDDDVYIRSDGGSDWVMFDNSAREMGIGTLTPGADLDILAGGWVDIMTLGLSSTSYKLRFGSGSTWASISGGTTNRDDIAIDQATGEIGIGTVYPGARLHVTGSIDDAAGHYLLLSENTHADGVGIQAVGSGVTSWAWPSAGAGLAANSSECAVYARASQTGNNGQSAIWTYLSGAGLAKTVKINYQSTGGTHYKIQGDGLVSTTMATSVGKVALASPESPEPWIDDYGSGQIVGGTCHVECDPIYLDCVTVNGEHPLKVFIELTSPLVNQYYISKGQTGFDVIVVGDGAGTASATFDYRVVGKWKGCEDFRFEPVEAPAEMKTATVTQPVQMGDNQ